VAVVVVQLLHPQFQSLISEDLEVQAVAVVVLTVLVELLQAVLELQVKEMLVVVEFIHRLHLQ
jgi:hypothetical protein